VKGRVLSKAQVARQVGHLVAKIVETQLLVGHIGDVASDGRKVVVSNMRKKGKKATMSMYLLC
jgi:hypothetical protein